MKKKIIKDLVHGYISVDEDVCKIVDHVSFQRLKGISQLTAHHLFPSANHTRFEHSLGVMYLAMAFYDKLKPFIKTKMGEDFTEDFNYKISENLRYAALLHDVGHGPLSHLGEGFYEKEEIIDALSKIDASLIPDIENGTKHEIMSCYVIVKNFKPVLDDNKDLKKVLDYHLIFRIITGTKYNNSKDMWVENLLISIVNSTTVDVDKLDYLMRDSFMTGNVAPRIDIERLISSLTIGPDNQLSFTPMGIPSLISFMDSRDFLYLWVYNHHTVVYTDYLYKTIISHLLNPKNTISNSNNILKRSDLFSTKAITENFISDCNVEYHLYDEYINSLSDYSKTVLSQLLERKFLQPIWKTNHDYEIFINKNHDKKFKEEIEGYIDEAPESGENSLGRLVNEIITQVNKKKPDPPLQLGQLFIIKRSNKFYSMSTKSIFKIYDEKKKSYEALETIMPLRNYGEIYSKIAFYIFTRDKLISEVMEAFLDIMEKKIEMNSACR